jgi:hypothetical protein
MEIEISPKLSAKISNSTAYCSSIPISTPTGLRVFVAGIARSHHRS